jgi:hypothetical protein
MHRNQLVRMMVVGLGLGLLGCDADRGAEHLGGADIGPRAQAGNGQVLNSAVLNGIQFNGIQFNGIQFNGIQFNGIQFNGIQFNGIQFNGSSFSGTLDVGDGPVQKSGLDFIGAEIQLSGGADTYTLRFDNIYKNPAQPTSEVYFYAISWRDDAVGTWSSLCTDGAGGPIEAIPIANYWDMATGARVDDAAAVTFACRGAVLAKCVEWGYVPWRSATMCDEKGNNCVVKSLRDHHQACTRMARADYCGNGRSYTFNDTPIDLYDRVSPKIQARTTSGTAWPPEAEWGPGGATCVGDELRLQMFDDEGIPYTFPACLDALDDVSGCGAFHKSRPASLVANAYCYEWIDDPTKCGGPGDDQAPKKPAKKK